ncbi:hypothetical protein BGZ70_008385 [Mortierella alpina]|uniref:SAP domain-containing protein n=1 Tax=Mortierella alpina TaxID=64518 RepID=A0A9P6JFN3_MORAP|nr:hypothetical protein BGZ70_008385 [Mortierella alpina]
MGLSSTGMREDLVERIRNYVATSGNSTLRAQIRDDSPDISTRPTTVRPSSSASNYSSPIKKPRRKVTVDDDIDDLDEDHPLPEHKVRQFMEHMQGELHQASHLAHQLEDTLQAKFTIGNSGIDQDTVTTTTRFGNRHYADGQDDSEVMKITLGTDDTLVTTVTTQGSQDGVDISQENCSIASTIANPS